MSPKILFLAMIDGKVESATSKVLRVISYSRQVIKEPRKKGNMPPTRLQPATKDLRQVSQTYLIYLCSGKKSIYVRFRFIRNSRYTLFVPNLWSRRFFLNFFSRGWYFVVNHVILNRSFFMQHFCYFYSLAGWPKYFIFTFFWFFPDH